MLGDSLGFAFSVLRQDQLAQTCVELAKLRFASVKRVVSRSLLSFLSDEF